MARNIVNENEILDRVTIMGEDWNLHRIYFETTLSALQWCARRRLIKNSVECPTCQIAKSFIKRNDRGDGYKWRCRNCLANTSVRSGSFFSQSHLTLQQIINIIYCRCRDHPQREIAHEAGIFEAGHTIVDWCNFCREVCERDLEENPMEVGGFDQLGVPKIVEIDESKFFHRKYNRALSDRGIGFLEELKEALENVSWLKYQTEMQKHYLLLSNINLY
jgi:transposase-like protein